MTNLFKEEYDSGSVGKNDFHSLSRSVHNDLTGEGGIDVLVDLKNNRYVSHGKMGIDCSPPWSTFTSGLGRRDPNPRSYPRRTGVCSGM